MIHAEPLMELVTVFRTFSVAEAQVVRGRLEAAGFLVHVDHELAALSIEGYSLATGGIKVRVPEAEAKEAAELLHSTPSSDA